MKVLIIDDSPDALMVAKARLAVECDNIICADGGIPGLELANREKPDIILLDLDMPDMSGYDVCRALKANPDMCMIPVLFLSGLGNAEDKVKGLDLGAVDYITKPFDTFELRARVRAALRTKRMQDLLINYAHIDPLTGLPNRRALMERLQSEWARIDRHGGRMAFIMADVDHFKQYNDTYGHHIGDRILQEVAQVFTRQCRATDLPARYGGDEFAVFLPCETASDAANLAKRCLKEIESIRLTVNNGTITATSSFGVADSENATSPEELIENADQALYQAKAAGRNTVQCCQMADTLADNDHSNSDGPDLTTTEST
jgi:two-component system, cell cycle response regulator